MPPMDAAEFRNQCKGMLDYIVKYLETVHERRVSPQVEFGYLKNMIPMDAPDQSEPWEDIIADIEPKIMPGMVHWTHPRFHGHFPSCMSYPAILGDIISDTIGVIGFSWASGPSCTELEGVVLDWIGKMMNLPKMLLSANVSPGSQGGGCIQSSSSECICITVMAARAKALRKLKEEDDEADEGVMLSKLIAYCSKEAHTCVEKGCMIGFTKLRILETDEHFSLRGDTVRKAMEQDRQNGLLPFYLCATYGTTASCAVDNIREIGPVCEDYDVWFHIDAAYAGNAQILPEYQEQFEGCEYAMSINVNASKWLLTNFDCACFWVKDQYELTQALVVEPLYLQHHNSDQAVDYRHWGLPLSRRMRSVKLWFVLRTYGVEGLQKYLREHIRLAQQFAALVGGDQRFEVLNKVEFGLVTFRLKNGNEVNQKLLATINASGKLLLTPASLNKKYVLRFCVNRESACDGDITYAWDVIRTIADEVEKSIKKAPEGTCV